MYEFSILKFDGDKSPKTSEAYFWHKADMKIKEEMWVTQRQWRQNKTSERDKDRERGRRGNEEVDGEIQGHKESPEKSENMMADDYKAKLIKI